jgi:hypothetical protein
MGMAETLPPLPPGAAQPPMRRPQGDGTHVVVDNRTSLPDDVVREAVYAHWVESQALQFGQPSTFQMYATNPQGSMLSRSPFRTPSNVIEEIKLARSVVDTDDDIAAVVGQAIATAFGDGMENLHEDEKTVLLFNKLCGPVNSGGMNMDRVLKEMYREYLVAASVTSLSLFTRTRYNFQPSSGERVQAQLATPLVGVIPAENIRVLTNDIFGNGELAYEPTDPQLRDWLEKFFAKTTSAAIRNQMREEEPILAAIFLGKVEVPWNDTDMFTQGKTLYTLNPRMVHRMTMPKGASAYPRPPLTANFALLEAKRLLNIMDYSLLQGGTNYIVVAKQGSDQRPAIQSEVDNLTDQVRTASRTGVLVGDHRLDIEIITPDLGELLNPAKRKLIGRKLAMALLRIPEQVTADAGNEGSRSELEFTARTITSDRRDIRRHVEGTIYEEIAERNPSTFTKGPPTLWFPKIILSGVKDFYDSVIKARDRGDIPRKWAVEVLGYPYEAGVSQRRREKAQGDDLVMTPAEVPFNGGPGNGPPNDTPSGRPPGSSPNNGRPGSPPGRQPGDPRPQLPPGVTGESISAVWDEGGQVVVRYGQVTAAILEQYPEASVGRVTQFERDTIADGETAQRGALTVVPVNPDYECPELRAFRLEEDLGLIVGRTAEGWLVTKAITTREPTWRHDEAIARAVRWGFHVAVGDTPQHAPGLPPLPPGIDPQPVPAANPLTAAIAAVLKDASFEEVVAGLGKMLSESRQPIYINVPGGPQPPEPGGGE